MVGEVASMPALPHLVPQDMFEKDYGRLRSADMLPSMCLNALAEDVAAVHKALCLSFLSSLAFASLCKLQQCPGIVNKVARFELGDTGTSNVVCARCSCCLTLGWRDAELCLLSPLPSIMTTSTSFEEYSLSTCKVHDENGSLKCPDTSVRLRSKETNAWLAVAKNKDDDDDDDDDDEDDDDEEDDDDDDVGEEEGAGDDGEGQEEVEGDEGNDDDEGGEDEDDDDDDEDGKGDEEDEDEDGVEDDEDDEDEEDETPEPPQKKRK